MDIRILPDDTLVKMYAEGNNEAFEVLLLRYKNKVFSYIYVIVKNRDLADDFFQETFMRAIMCIKKGQYAESGKFISWITRIAHNLIFDKFRQEKYQKTYSNDENEEVDLLNNSQLCESTIEDRMVKEQVLNDVSHIVKFLPDTQREVVLMRYYDDLSFKEIAEKTNVSINTALGRMRYAIQNMRRIADEKGISLDLN
ncbi:MAG: sigma-70 family RNA polymerase sigma factor [Paludibacteraceae bacterium]|jgi:RNA polymerase sigma-70 factor (ECF subfamily)|nr:sigma-70 family RNA polymerase sigma factor [Paludibacteraceae bacterium]